MFLDGVFIMAKLDNPQANTKLYTVFLFSHPLIPYHTLSADIP